MVFLGIDGGGSRTRALLTDASGQILGQSLSGPTNPRTTSSEKLHAHLLTALNETCGQVDPSSIRAAHFGIAGAGGAAAREQISQLTRTLLPQANIQITVGHDLEIALEGALAGAPGIVLVAGTGSACYGRDANGRTVECGGWGDLVDDAGSGSWFGLRALQICVRQADGRLPESPLMSMVMDFLGIQSMSDFKTRIHEAGLPRKERAELAPRILELAANGDASAAAILDEASDALCELAASANHQLGDSTLPIVLCGGLSEHPGFRAATWQALRARGLEGHSPRLPAVAGAVLLALKSAGVAASESTFRKLNSAA